MTRKGVWGLQQVRDKYLASLWVQSYTIWAMGQGNKGEILNNENGDGASRSSPTQLGGTLEKGWKTVDSGSYGSFYATRDDGELWVCGANNEGQLGQNNKTYRSSPVQVPGTTWDTVKGRGEIGMANKTDGTMWTWGQGATGRLGQNSQTTYSSPKQVGTDTTWTNKFYAGSACGAIKTDGTLWMWGDNGDGRLGQNNKTQYSSPRQLPGTTWSEIVTVGPTTIALKTDNTMWTWGNNEVGSLGVNSRTDYSSPKQLPGSWSSIAGTTGGSEAGMAAINTSGELYTWGGNEQAELGQNNKSDYSSPTQVGTDATWVRVWGTGSDDGRKMWATKTDGTLWNWGRGAYGALDHNSTTSYSSPRQVGTETVYSGLNKDQIGANQRTCYIMRPLLTPSQL